MVVEVRIAEKLYLQKQFTYKFFKVENGEAVVA